MKTITIKGADTLQYDYSSPNDKDSKKDIFITGSDAMQISDGSHTFEELYNHRYELWIAICRSCAQLGDFFHGNKATEVDEVFKVWRSKNHSDGTPAFDGKWFLLGIGEEKGNQITYHLPIDRWDECDFAETLDKAPEWDGHTSADVLERLKTL